MTDRTPASCIAAAEDARVQLHLPASALERLTKLLMPFVSLQLGRCARPAWTLHASTTNSRNAAAMSRGEHHRIETQGEPVHDLWVCTKDRQITLVCLESLFLPVAITRLVSHLLRIECLGDGHLFMHAAAVAIGGQAILLAGKKKSGKTTLSMALMRQHGANFVSNDNPSLQHDGRAWSCRGWPRSIRIRKDMLPALGLVSPDARPIVLSHPLNRDLPLPCTSSDLVPPVAHVFPYELMDLYGNKLLTRSPLHAIVFLDPVCIDTPTQLTRLSVGEAMASCEANSFPAVGLPSLSHAHYLASLVTKHTTPREALSRLTFETPCYTLGGSLADIPKSVALLAQLFVQPSPRPFSLEGLAK